MREPDGGMSEEQSTHVFPFNVLLTAESGWLQAQNFVAMWSKQRQMTNDAKLNQLFSDYLADKNRQKEYGKKQSALLRKLKSFYSATTLSDTKYCDWLCSVADNLDKQGNARYLADILYVEAYRNIHDMMIIEASISDENFAKCKLTLENWGTELDKEDSGSHYTLNQGKEINETIIRFCLEKVDYICSQQNLPDSQYCLLAEKVLNYIVYAQRKDIM